MEKESEITLTSCPQTSCPSPDPDPESPDRYSSTSATMPHCHMVIPNRIFVGGIHVNTNESDLKHFFSQHGAVENVNIVRSHTGMSVRYGFVTFETKEDVENILHDANRMYFKEKKLNIGQAFRRKRLTRYGEHFQVPSLSPGVPLHLTTSNGYPYTYQNGVAYFHSLDMHPPARHWPAASGSPVMLSHPHQSAYQQPPYHHYQYTSNHLQWNGPPTPTSSGLVLHVQPAQYLYQHVDRPNDGVPPPPPPILEPTFQAVCPGSPFSLVHVKPSYSNVAILDYITETPEAADIAQ